MKAQVLEKNDLIDNRPLKLLDIEIPNPRPDQVLIKVKVCGICLTDLHVVEGDLEMKQQPIIPGHQIVGEIVQCGDEVKGFQAGERVGVAWLRATCGSCHFCKTNRENLCDKARFTGWSANGGFAEYTVAPAQFLYKIPEGYPDIQAAPLLCAGIIGYRSLKLMNIQDWQGMRIGIYGFGAAGHIAIQLLKAWGAEVYVCTRDQNHQELALELGATWAGGTITSPSHLLQASVVFAPAGEIVPAALKALDKDGRLILAGIHMSNIPEMEYKIIYGEKMIKSVANNTRQAGLEFLEHASSIGIQTHVEKFALKDANEALYALKYDHIQGAGVLVVR